MNLYNYTSFQKKELTKKYSYLICTVLISPIIVIGNVFVILSFIQSRRVRSPSNQLILFLAILDLQLGCVMILPFVTHDEQMSYGFELGLSLLTLFFMVSIALDKALSLAKSFIYSNLMTWTNVHIYSTFLMLGTFFITIIMMGHVPRVDRDFQIMIFGLLLLPSLVLILSAYVYIYAVAILIQAEIKITFDGPFKNRQFPKYGVTLLITVVAILASRLPASLSVLIYGQSSEWSSHLLNLPLYLCSAFNPWIYAYHNLEIKIMIKKLIQRAWKLYNSIIFCTVPPIPRSSHANNPRTMLIFTRKQGIINNSKNPHNSTLGLTQPKRAVYHSNRMAVKLIHKSFHSVCFYENNPRASV
ncbi:unnamed protein product [Lepeophtheirus salmonis]|uniref:(salmon louse) hypothetical protein n=1 Tax=Lepeophtheirus salmonis TaxID=72036 RepID=A0A7R8CP94_LEPSM|nr:unnamed protein product [Lepeophtheirus salmonis]CAF2883263.1 unnamed protein product [Lepeophtheirus salmonis]